VPEHTIHFDTDSEKNNFLRQHLRNELQCEVCESKQFKAERNSPKQIMLTCVDCGWVYMIGPETFGEKNLHLKFSYQKK